MGNVANDRAWATAWAETRALSRDWQTWVGLGGVAMVLGLIGPFDTYGQMPRLPRLAYWAVLTVSTFWIGYFTSATIATWAETRGLTPWASIVAGGVVASLPIAIWVAALHVLVLGQTFWSELSRLWPYILVIAPLIGLVFDLAERRNAPQLTASKPTQMPDWVAQLPSDIGRDLILLQAQDHYVRAETARGETLIRASLGQAAEALGDYGLRVHRSWWVARHCIAAQRYRGSAPVLVLKTGQEVPVGRAYRPAVKAALRGG